MQGSSEQGLGMTGGQGTFGAGHDLLVDSCVVRQVHPMLQAAPKSNIWLTPPSASLILTLSNTIDDHKL